LFTTLWLDNFLYGETLADDETER